ncbi:hypothetical protein SGLAM104S_00815 [Streptomyces glaucescens]
MHQAAVTAEDAVRVAVRDLNKWAAEARAGKMNTGELTAVDKLMRPPTPAPRTPPPNSTRSSAPATWSAPAAAWTS